MKAKRFIPFIGLGLFATISSMYGMMINGDVVLGMVGFSLAVIGMGYSILKFIEINYPIKRPPLTYE